jgi:alpha-1,2-mannosyltransferase
MFKYLPFSAVLYAPLSLLPLESAKALWYVSLVLCSVGIFYMSYKMSSAKREVTTAMIVFPPLILAKFCFREMKLGQINLIVALILLFMVWSLISKRSARAGLFWGLATSIKPYGMMFLPYFIVKKQWTALASGVGVIVFALLVPSIFYGIRGNFTVLREWTSTLSQSTPTLLTSHDNVSIIAFWSKWTQNTAFSPFSLWVAGAMVVALAALVLTMIWKGKKLEEPVALECGLLFMLIPLVSPLGWDYQLLMSVLAVTILVYHFFDYSRPWQILLVVNFCIISLSIYDVMGRSLYNSFMVWSVLTVNFLILVGYLGYLRFRRHA